MLCESLHLIEELAGSYIGRIGSGFLDAASMRPCSLRVRLARMRSGEFDCGVRILRAAPTRMLLMIDPSCLISWNFELVLVYSELTIRFSCGIAAKVSTRYVTVLLYIYSAQRSVNI